MSDLKHTTKDAIDDAAEALKKAASTVIDKTKDMAHSAGEKMVDTGKKLKDA